LVELHERVGPLHQNPFAVADVFSDCGRTDLVTSLIEGDTFTYQSRGERQEITVPTSGPVVIR
jgi:hypothetical protein